MNYFSACTHFGRAIYAIMIAFACYVLENIVVSQHLLSSCLYFILVYSHLLVFSCAILIMRLHNVDISNCSSSSNTPSRFARLPFAILVLTAYGLWRLLQVLSFRPGSSMLLLLMIGGYDQPAGLGWEIFSLWQYLTAILWMVVICFVRTTPLRTNMRQLMAGATVSIALLNQVMFGIGHIFAPTARAQVVWQASCFMWAVVIALLLRSLTWRRAGTVIEFRR
jgi:hypothetical protein